VRDGADGSANTVKVLRNDGTEEVYGCTPESLRIEKGEVIRLITENGGDYCDPLKRPRDEGLDDLRDGYITPAQRKRDYGLDLAAAAE
jgi:N-methylhydantoinase B